MIEAGSRRINFRAERLPARQIVGPTGRQNHRRKYYWRADGRAPADEAPAKTPILVLRVAERAPIAGWRLRRQHRAPNNPAGA